MNQPSAEELIASFYQSGDGHLPHKIIAQRILARYLMIDKSEPIPGAVDAYKLTDAYGRQVSVDPLVFVARDFDVFPKGTVARLMDDLDRIKEKAQHFADAVLKSNSTIEKLDAEIDQLKGELEMANRTIFDIVVDEPVKPEAVGCGREFTYKYTPANQWKMPVCGEWGHICPDCQAKANNPEKPDSSKVTLPEVPTLLSEYTITDLHNAIGKLIECYHATKAHLEGEG